MQSPLSTSANMRSRILVSYMYLICGVLFFLCRRVLSHGRLIEPPGRSTMWRYGFNTPVNYNDNELYCGGKSHQWDVNGGKCGVCGDPFDGPRDNEAGGKYATGTISRCFNDTRSPLVVRVEITANHKGYFEFRLCPHDDPSTPVTQECLNDHLLMMYGSEDTRYHIGTENKVYEVELKMPESITCTQCVLQWKYNTGNSWGCNSTHCENGLGPQEQFYGCADISVGIDCGAYSTTSTPKPSSSKFQSEHSTISSTDLPKSTVSSSRPSDQTSNLTFSSTTLNPQETNSTMSTNNKTSSSPSHTTASIANKDCRAAGAFTGQQAMTQWCRANCIIGFCPTTQCECVEKTTGSHSSASSTTSTSSSPLSSLSSRLTITAESTNTETSTSSTSASTVVAASQSTHPSTISQSMRPSTTSQSMRPSTTSQSISPSTTSQSMRPSTSSQSMRQSTTSQSMRSSPSSQSTEPSTTLQSMRLSTTTSAISETTKTISAQSTANEQSETSLQTISGENSANDEEITTLQTKTESSTASEHPTTVALLSTGGEQLIMSRQSSTNSEQLSTQSEHSTRTSIHSTTSRQTTSGQSQSQTLSCDPTPVYSSVAGMAAWCLTNCQQGFCPSSHCVCTLS